MPDRRLSSRILRAFGRLLRRLTIGLGALILVVYFFGDWLLSNWPYPACSEWPKSSLANARGDVAEIGVQGCFLGLVNRQYLVRVRPAGGVSAKLVVRFKPKEWPALHWLDADRLQADLGQVRSISPQIDQVGPVHVTFTFSGVDPSLD
ncbi:MAG: hypothetical protein ACREDM_04285 [Methylocella sp.]